MEFIIGIIFFENPPTKFRSDLDEENEKLIKKV